MGKTLLVPCLVTPGKSCHLFMSKSSTLHLSSGGSLSPEDSESLITSLGEAAYFSSLGQEVVLVLIEFPCYSFSSIFLKSCFYERPTSMYLVVSSLVSLARGWFTALHHASHPNSLLCNSNPCMVVSPDTQDPSSTDFSLYFPSAICSLRHTPHCVSSSRMAPLPNVNSHAAPHKFLPFSPLSESLFRFDL